MFDAKIVLSNRGAIKSAQVSIKADLNKDELEIENILLKERRALINYRTKRKNIKIRGIPCMSITNLVVLCKAPDSVNLPAMTPQSKWTQHQIDYLADLHMTLQSTAPKSLKMA